MNLKLLFYYGSNTYDEVFLVWKVMGGTFSNNFIQFKRLASNFVLTSEFLKLDAQKKVNWQNN